MHLLGPGMLVLLDRAFDSNARASGTALESFRWRQARSSVNAPELS